MTSKPTNVDTEAVPAVTATAAPATDSSASDLVNKLENLTIDSTTTTAGNKSNEAKPATVAATPAKQTSEQQTTSSPTSPTTPSASSSPTGRAGRPPPRERVTLSPKQFRDQYHPERNIIPDNSIESIASVIKSGAAKRIIIMSGAGMSTAAGIPDFRSPGTGLYHNLQKFNLPYAEAIFDIEYFVEKPDAFYALARELYPGQFRPTLSHYFVKLLADKGLLLRHFTQNIDCLEREAGVKAEFLVEAHGTFFTASCIRRDCQAKYDADWVKERIFAGSIPRCTKCSGEENQPKEKTSNSEKEEKKKEKENEDEDEDLADALNEFFTGKAAIDSDRCHPEGSLVKPDITFFGESMPSNFFERVHDDFPNCDLLIVMGTSLKVQPFGSLVDMVGKTVPRLLINRDRVGVHGRPSSGFDFEGDFQKFRRDAEYLGSCDDGCRQLAKLLGWEDELMDLYHKSHAELDAKHANDLKLEDLTVTKKEEEDTIDQSVIEAAQDFAERLHIHESH
ncbi:SIR2-domain-containing protein [Ramicandelaber brevisporus]|nr:SIR2-domain-containing protein [Ramicandelaber brevisporus]